MENKFSFLVFLGIISTIILIFIILIYLMKGLDALIFWFQTKNAKPFIPNTDYKSGTVVRHFNMYLKVKNNLGSCKDCYFNTCYYDKHCCNTINCSKTFKRLYKN